MSPYYPDLPEIREDWARLHDLITHMDNLAGARLRELEERGVADEHADSVSSAFQFMSGRFSL